MYKPLKKREKKKSLSNDNIYFIGVGNIAKWLLKHLLDLFFFFFF